MTPVNSPIEKVSSTRALLLLVLFCVFASGMSAGAMGFPKPGATEISCLTPVADVDHEADDELKWLENSLPLRQLSVETTHFTGLSQVLLSRPNASLAFARAPPARSLLHR